MGGEWGSAHLEEAAQGQHRALSVVVFENVWLVGERQLIAAIEFDHLIQ